MGCSFARGWSGKWEPSTSLSALVRIKLAIRRGDRLRLARTCTRLARLLLPTLFCVHAGGQGDESYFRKQASYAAGGGRVVRLHLSRGRSECDSSPRHFCEPYSRFSGLHLGCRNGSGHWVSTSTRILLEGVPPGLSALPGRVRGFETDTSMTPLKSSFSDSVSNKVS